MSSCDAAPAGVRRERGQVMAGAAAAVMAAAAVSEMMSLRTVSSLDWAGGSSGAVCGRPGGRAP